MKKKLSKRLAVLLLLLVAAAVGGAYVLTSVNTGEGALAAAAYSAVGMKSYMPLQYDYSLYGQQFGGPKTAEDQAKPKEDCSPLMPSFLCGAPEKGQEKFKELETKVGRDKKAVGAMDACAKKKGQSCTVTMKKNADGEWTIVGN